MGAMRYFALLLLTGCSGAAIDTPESDNVSVYRALPTPRCSWNIPTLDMGGEERGVYQDGVSACSVNGDATEVVINQETLTVLISLERFTANGISVAVGVPLDASKAEDAVYFGSIGANCSDWTGTVELISPAPRWQIDLDVACTHGGVRLKGSVSGNTEDGR